MSLGWTAVASDEWLGGWGQGSPCAVPPACVSAFPAQACRTWEQEEKEPAGSVGSKWLRDNRDRPGLAGSPEHCGMLAGAASRAVRSSGRCRKQGAQEGEEGGWEDQRQSGQSHSADGT